MRDGQNLDAVPRLAEHNEEGKSTEKVSTRLAEVRRPPTRRLLESLDGRIELGHERLSRLSAAGVVPLSCSAGFLDRLGMNPCTAGRHYRLGSCAELQATVQA